MTPRFIEENLATNVMEIYEDIYQKAGEELRFKLCLLNYFGKRFELCHLLCTSRLATPPLERDCFNRTYWIEEKLVELGEEKL